VLGVITIDVTSLYVKKVADVYGAPINRFTGHGIYLAPGSNPLSLANRIKGFQQLALP
jgi:hypothetical protein